MRGMYSPHAAVFAALLLVPLAAIQNIDTDQPIVRQVSDIANGSLFGYSLVLHQTRSSVANMNESIKGVR